MLSHAARLELIRSVFSAIPVYYMSNILFSKKFIAKLTAVIRNFWWTGIRETDYRKSLCLRAWKDISNSKTEGGLGIRNLRAINESLILAAAWRVQLSSLISSLKGLKFILMRPFDLQKFQESKWSGSQSCTTGVPGFRSATDDLLYKIT
ncbi:hypothetical protein ACQJBY_041928 [Aegilops geniculata]